MSSLLSRNRGIRLPDDQPRHHDRNAFDLTVWDMISQSTCGACLPCFRKHEATGPQLNYFDEEDDYEFEGLLAAQDQDQLTSFLSGNPFGKRGRTRARQAHRRGRIPAEEDEGFEGDEEEDEGHGSRIYDEMEPDAEFLGNDQIDRFTELVGRETYPEPNDDGLNAEERALAEEEEAEIIRKRQMAQTVAIQKGLVQQDEGDYYPEFEGDSQMVDFTTTKHDDSNLVPYPVAHISPVARAVPYVVDGTLELEEQYNESKIQAEHTVEERTDGDVAQASTIVEESTPEPNPQPKPTPQPKRASRTNSTLFTAQLEDLTKKLSFIKNNVLASLDDNDDTKDEPIKKDADEVSLNDEELEEYTARAEQSRKARPVSHHGTISGLNNGSALFSSNIVTDDSPFSMFTGTVSNSSGSNPSESNRASEDDENVDNILPAPVAKIATAAWSYANKTIQNVDVDEAAQKFQVWFGKAASVAQKAATHVAEGAKNAWAFVGEEGEHRPRSREETLLADRKRELDGRMRGSRSNSLQPPQQSVAPQPSISAPSRGGFV